MVLCAALWSTAGIFIKVIPWNPVVIAGLRSLISGLVFLIYMKYFHTGFVLNKHSILGGIFLSGTFIFFIAANKMTTAANAIVLQFTAPIFILILSSIIFKQKFKSGDIIAVVFTTIGISLFFLDKISGDYLLGNVVAIISGLFFASMFVTNGRADEKSKMSGILLGHIFTAVISIPYIIIYPPTLSTISVATIFILGIFQLGIPYILYGLASRQCSPLACSLISAVEPLLNPLWVFIFNGEAPGFYALVGGIIVISSVASWCVWSSKSS